MTLPRFPWAFACRHAARMVWRQRGRNAFVLTTVTGVCVFSLWMVAVFDAKNADLVDAIKTANTGELQWLAPAYERERSPFPPAALPTGLTWPEGWRASPELVSPATIVHTDGPRGVKLIGIHPSQHISLFGMPEMRWLDGQEGFAAVLGESLARALDVVPGDNVPIYVQTGDGGLRSENLRVAGIYRRHGPSYEETYLYLSHSGMRTLLGLPDDPGLFHRLVAYPGPGPAPASLKAFPRRTWQQVHPELAAVVGLQDGITRFFMIYMLAVGILAIGAPIAVLWQERLPELRMLSTVGVPRAALLRLGVFEAGWLYLFTMVVTGVVGGMFAWGTSHVGIDLAWLGQTASARAGIQIPQVVTPLYRPEAFAAMAAFNFVVIFAGYLWSMRKVVGEMERTTAHG